MNIFVLDLDPQICARYHCDKHVTKMILEHTQMLCSAMHIHNISPKHGERFYKPTHLNHPCTRWVSQAQENVMWLFHLTMYLNDEFMFRFNKSEPHASWTVMENLIHYGLNGFPLAGGQTPFVTAMDDSYKIWSSHGTLMPVESYRNYYIKAKADLLDYTGRGQPLWITSPEYNQDTFDKVDTALKGEEGWSI